MQIPTLRYITSKKGILQERIMHAGFKGVYVFQPSLLVTDEDRYGFGQKLPN